MRAIEIVAALSSSRDRSDDQPDGLLVKADLALYRAKADRGATYRGLAQCRAGRQDGAQRGG